MSSIIGKSVKSTGVNIICGHVSLNFAERFIWHLVNYFENHLPDSVKDGSCRINYHRLSMDTLSSIISEFPDTLVLPRALCNIFWETVNWNDIEEELGNIKILDIGCGGGRLFQHFFDKLPERGFSANYHYTGVDISAKENWHELSHDRRVDLYEDDIVSFLKKADFDFNLIVSQSAFEHIRQDLYTHQIMAKFLKQTQRPTIQIHLVPSRACHALYGIHGYRHYDLQKLSRISHLYSRFSESFIFPLGNSKINEFHVKWGRGSDEASLRFVKQNEYLSLRNELLVRHYESNNNRNYGRKCFAPTFYAVVIQSHLKVTKNLSHI